MSDLFYPEVSLSYIKRVFAVMHRAHWHQYQILTKRSERLLKLSGELDWAPQMDGSKRRKREVRASHRRSEEDDAQVKFLLLEPLLGPLRKLKLRDIDWAIVGGESGPGARPYILTCNVSGINVSKLTSRFSLSNGVASIRRGLVARSKAVLGSNAGRPRTCRSAWIVGRRG